MDISTIPCERNDCRLERLPNVATNLPITPAVLDRDGKEVTPAVNPNSTTFYVYCSVCDRTFQQDEANGTKGAWSSVAGKVHPTIAEPEPAPEAQS